MEILPEDGLLAVCGEHPLPVEIARKAHCEVVTYGFSDSHDWQAVDPKPRDGGYEFTIRSPIGELTDVWSPMTGRHNVLNTLAAFAAVSRQGVTLDELAQGLRTFQGVGKRQEVKGWSMT